MTRGKLYGDRYALKWLNDGVGLTLGIWAFGGHTVGQSTMMGRPRAAGYRCTDCKKIVIDENESDDASTGG